MIYASPKDLDFKHRQQILNSEELLPLLLGMIGNVWRYFWLSLLEYAWM